MGLKKRMKKKIKTELGYMGKGAKVVGKVAAKKGKAWLKAQIAEAKEQSRIAGETRKAVQAAELQAFRKESVKQATIRGKQKAQARARAGSRPFSVAGILGFEEMQKGQGKGLGASEYLFGGLGKKGPKKEEED